MSAINVGTPDGDQSIVTIILDGNTYVCKCEDVERIMKLHHQNKMEFKREETRSKTREILFKCLWVFSLGLGATAFHLPDEAMSYLQKIISTFRA